MADSFEPKSRPRSSFHIASVSRWGRAVRLLLGGYAAIFAVQFYLYHGHTPARQIEHYFVLSADSLASQPWAPFSFFLFHSPQHPIHFLTIMAALVIVAPELERRLGPRLFLALFVISAIGGGAAHLLVTALVEAGTLGTLGTAGAIYGLLLAYFCFFPDSEFFGLAKGKWLAPLLAIMVFASGWDSLNQALEYRAQVAGAVFGGCFLIFVPRFGQWKARRTSRRQIQEIVRDSELMARVDDLLGKISREGMDSLTRAERRTLDRASQRYRLMVRGEEEDTPVEGP